jgi:hypothetical protein
MIPTCPYRKPRPASKRRQDRVVTHFHVCQSSLGIDIGQTSVAKYMARRRRPPPQGWRTFLRNHADGIAAMDLSLLRHLLAAAQVAYDIHLHFR